MDLQLLEELANEELRFKKFTFVGDDRVLVSGSLKTGFAVNINRVPEVEDTTPPTTGACCSGSWPTLTCSVVTEADCLGLSGHYLGNGTTCAGVNCNSGACCEFFGGCSDEAESLCFDFWQGYGTACADTRCEGFCCVACNDEICPGAGGLCTCYPSDTYDECQERLVGFCSVSWLFDGAAYGYTCNNPGGFPDPQGASDFCCTQFGSFACQDRCAVSGDCCCCYPGGICGSAVSQEDCDAICSPCETNLWFGFLPVAEQCTTCGESPCGA